MKKLFILIAAVFCGIQVLAQSRIDVQAPNLVAADEQFNVTFVIEGENSVSSFEWNPGDDFKIVWGPQKGSSTSISIINGKRTTSVQNSYTYIIMPKKEGSFRLPSATAKVKGEEIRSGEVSIDVVSSGSQASSSQSSSSRGSSQENGSTRAGGVSSEDIYLRLLLSKNSAVLGETISATLKLYQRVGVSGFEDARFPTFDGFWSQETYTPSNIEFKRENVGDKIYNTAILRSWTLIPQRSGELKIDPSELICLVNVRAQRAPTGSIFDSFFQDDYQTVRKRLSTPAVTVKVSALPAGAPASFCGGVGTFKLQASVTKDSLAVHDAASLVINVSGTGNVALLEAPKVNFPPDFECYDVKTSDIPGGKSFEFPFIPRASGEFAVGPVEYGYYDNNAKRYVTLKSQEFRIKVAKGNGGDTTSYPSAVMAPSSRKDVRNLGSDIRYISTSTPSFSPSDRFFVGSAGFWIVIIALSLLSILYFAGMSKLAKRRADVVGSRNRAATKMARKRLSSAGKYLDEGLQTAFYESLHKALLGFASDKLNMDMSDMTMDNIETKFITSGVEEAVAKDFSSLLQACEFARYSPSSDSEAMKQQFEKSVEVISSIDGKMKRNRTGKSSLPVLLAALMLIPSSFEAGAQTISSQDADSLWLSGIASYDDGRWDEAYTTWFSLAEAGYSNPELFYNLGNAAFKQSDYAHSVLYYERALKADPSLYDARYNLEYVNALLVDRVESVPEFILKKWCRQISYFMSSNAWAVIGVIFFALILVCALMFALSRNPSLRKTGFFSGLVAIVLCLVCLSFAFSQKSDYYATDRAVVMVPVSSVKSAPGVSSVDLFVLHEGTVVKIFESAGDWREVELADGRKGWMRNSDINVI